MSELFNFLLNVPETDDCVLWPYGVNTKGYGRLTKNNFGYLAHRVSLSFSHGQSYPDLLACHKPLICHNPTCVNPRHLRWATPKQNTADKLVDKTMLKGQEHGSSKLSKSEVLAIKSSTLTQRKMAEIYGVSNQHISRIVSGKRWAHV